MTDMELSKAQLLEELAESRKSEEKWRSLAANAPIFIAIVDRDGVIQFLNRTQPGHTVHELLDQCLAEARHLINGMRPPILDEYGVIFAIQHLVCDSNDDARTEISFQDNVEFDRLEPVLENSIYRIVQESLSNACCHSKSDRVQIDLTQHDHRVQIAVQDWGIGFDPNHTEEECFGLAGIRERARLLGGQVQVDTKLGEGTRIAVDLPIEVEELDS